MTLIVLGTLFSLSSTRWLAIWLGFEINILGFTPLLLTFSPQRTEGAVKYLLVQASGSALLLIRGLLSWLRENSPFVNLESQSRRLLLILSLLLKIGVFPFYFWVPSVINRRGWTRCLLLITWQKVVPLTLLSYLHLTQRQVTLLRVIATFRILVGGLLGINQTQLRRLVAYSSIAHGGWMVLLTPLSFRALKSYFLIYSLISWTLLRALLSTSQTSLPQRKALDSKRGLDSLRIMVSLLSLGGIPPLIGFFAKFVAIQGILRRSMVWVLAFAIRGALISLRYYLTLLFSLFVSYSPLGLLRKNSSWGRGLSLTFNGMGLILIPLVLRLS